MSQKLKSFLLELIKKSLILATALSIFIFIFLLIFFKIFTSWMPASFGM